MEKRILILMTSHRLDCLKLNMELLEKHDQYRHFDRVVFLLNGVVGRHLDFIMGYIEAHPEIQWGYVKGPRGRSERISSLENAAIEKYPAEMYIKMDEDVFVGSVYAESMIAAYEAHKDEEDLALITPLQPNNAYGMYMLLTEYYPEFMPEYQETFGHELSPDIHSPTWRFPDVAEWMTRKFLDLEEANRKHQDVLKERDLPKYVRFTNRFSVGCVLFTRKHWEKMGGIPPKDEPEWCEWIEENGQFNVLDASQIALHYSFFVQQDWLDRGTLLDDIRLVNLPESLPGRSLVGYHLPRWIRCARQAPRIVKRRLGRTDMRS